MAKEIGVKGIVTDALTPDGSVHVEQMTKFIEAARPLPVTFHRAFDMTCNPACALEKLVSLPRLCT